MVERYSRVFLLEKNCYAPGCPVLVSAGAILIDNQTGKLYGQLKLRNLQEKTIKAVKVKLLCADVVGRDLEEQAEKWYLHFAARRDEEFGSKDLIPLENFLTGTISVIVEEVCFADNSVWTGNGTVTKPLPEPKVRAFFYDAELEKQFGLEFGKDFRTEPAEVEDLWYCACGSLNCSREPTCHNCKRVFSEIHSIDIEALTARKDARVAEEEAETARKALARAEKVKKITKTATILASATAFCIAAFMLITKVIIPYRNYKAAIALKDTAQYEAAISAFEAMEGYKDSDAQILACYYDAAMALKDSGEYEQAISAFSLSQLEGYNDAAEQITVCETAIKDRAYDNAVSLMDAGNYQAAYQTFFELDGYKDSTEQLIRGYRLLIANSKVGDTVYFGTYEQDNNRENGKEIIEWLVLEKTDNKLLVISKYALDSQQYNTKSTSVTWETCTLRTWLNGAFMKTAFTAEEKAQIVTAEVSAENNPNYNTTGGKETTDKVFLLSIKEANEYFNTDEERKCVPTDYASVHNDWNITTSDWWLRSPGFNSSSAACVTIAGSVNCGGTFVTRSEYFVRPVLWISY